MNQIDRSKEYLLSKLPNDGKGSVLEFGCGTGEVAINCAQKGLDTVGIDVSKNMIKIASDKANIRRLKNVQFLNQDYSGFRSNIKFDYLVLSYFLNIFPSEQMVEKVIKKGISHLKPTGTILIVDELEPYNKLLKLFTNILRYPIYAFFKIFAGVRYHRFHDLRKIMENLNIKIIEEKRFLFQYCSILIGKL